MTIGIVSGSLIGYAGLGIMNMVRQYVCISKLTNVSKLTSVHQDDIHIDKHITQVHGFEFRTTCSPIWFGSAYAQAVAVAIYQMEAMKNFTIFRTRENSVKNIRENSESLKYEWYTNYTKCTNYLNYTNDSRDIISDITITKENRQAVLSSILPKLVEFFPKGTDMTPVLDKQLSVGMRLWEFKSHPGTPVYFATFKSLIYSNDIRIYASTLSDVCMCYANMNRFPLTYSSLVVGVTILTQFDYTITQCLNAIRPFLTW